MKEGQPKSLRKRIAVTAAGLGIAGGLVAGAGQYTDNDPALFYRYAIDQAMAADCPSVSDAQIQRTEVILGRKLNPELNDYTKSLSEIARDAADKYKLTLINPDSHLEDLKKATTFESVLAVANQFSSRYGFSITFPSGIDLKDFPDFYSPVNSSNVDVANFKTGLDNLFKTLRYVPVELIRASGVNEVRMANIDQGPNGDPAIKREAGFYSYFSEKVTLDINDFTTNGGHYFLHEISHALDRKFCGISGMSNDQPFQDTNRTGFTYGQDEYEYFDFVSSYAETAIPEDKAETMAYIFEHGACTCNSKEVARKIVLALSRLDLQVPGILNYLKDTSLSKAEI